MQRVRDLVRCATRGALPCALASALLLAGCSSNPLDAVMGKAGSDTASMGSASATSSVRAEQAVANESLVEPGVLTVGIQTQSVGAPFFISGSGGKIEGIDIDLGAALASDMGLKVKYVEVGGVDAGLSERQCDIVMDVSAEKAGSATVLGGYYETGAAFFHMGPETVVTVADLSGHSVGLQSGSVSEGALNGTVLDMARKPYTNLNEAFAALAAGEVDYVLCDAYPGAYLASAYEGVHFAGALSAPTSVGIAASAGNTPLQEAVKKSLDALIANGSYSVIRSRWLGDLPTISPEQAIVGVPKSDQATTGGTAESVGGNNQDGSTAGANAVFVPNEL